MNGLGCRIRRFCAVIVGFILFVAGVLKLMDPVGTSLIVGEYMDFMHLGFLHALSGAVGEFFALTETVLGICLVTGVFRKFMAITVSILLGGFTLLTLVLWIFNPAMDCGCFGEAVHLTHFQSFAKNVVLCLLLAVALFPLRSIWTVKRRKYVTFGIVTASVVAFAIYSWLYIPMLELTPFNLSSRLYAATDESDYAENEYVATFVYEKNGKQGVFALDKLPDSTWTYVETRTVRKQDHINENSYPQLSFSDREGDLCDTLAVGDNVLVLSVPWVKKMSRNGWEKILTTTRTASGLGFRTLLLAAAAPESVEDAMAKAGVSEDTADKLAEHMYFADYKTLVSLNRSNGGAVYFDGGTLLEKWAFRSLPEYKELKKIIKKDKTEVMLDAENKGRLSFQAFMLYTSAFLLLL